MVVVDAAAEIGSAKKRRLIILWSIVALAALAVLTGLLLTGPRYIAIPSGSMLPTIRVSDTVLTESLTYRFRGPQPTDIILFDAPVEPQLRLIKRVVAVAGQQVDVRDGHLVVDGVVLSEPYTAGQSTDQLPNSRVSFPVQIPVGHVWVMGDNRTASQDSRWFGPVSISAILGKVAGVQ